jgi:hypothetical protein
MHMGRCHPSDARPFGQSRGKRVGASLSAPQWQWKQPLWQSSTAHVPRAGLASGVFLRGLRISANASSQPAWIWLDRPWRLSLSTAVRAFIGLPRAANGEELYPSALRFEVFNHAPAAGNGMETAVHAAFATIAERLSKRDDQSKLLKTQVAAVGDNA